MRGRAEELERGRGGLCVLATRPRGATMQSASQCDLPVGTGSWLSERALHACRKFQARSLLRPILAGIP